MCWSKASSLSWRFWRKLWQFLSSFSQYKNYFFCPKPVLKSRWQIRVFNLVFLEVPISSFRRWHNIYPSEIIGCFHLSTLVTSHISWPPARVTDINVMTKLERSHSFKILEVASSYKDGLKYAAPLTKCSR